MLPRQSLIAEASLCTHLNEHSFCLQTLFKCECLQLISPEGRLHARIQKVLSEGVQL